MKSNETIDRQHAICFTGHRPKDLFGYSGIETYQSSTLKKNVIQNHRLNKW